MKVFLCSYSVWVLALFAFSTNFVTTQSFLDQSGRSSATAAFLSASARQDRNRFSGDANKDGGGGESSENNLVIRPTASSTYSSPSSFVSPLSPLVDTTSKTSYGCPLRCLCFQTTVRCMFLHLEKIPAVPDDTTILDLRFNQIREIPPNSFRHLAKLDTLLLNNNHITRLRNGAFNGLNNLKFLYLYKNRIRDIQSKVFQDVHNLEQLYLHYNSIHEIQAETFSNLTRLERLFLHNNKIQRIPHGSFDNLNHMRRLRLDSNSLVCDCGMISLAQMLVDHPDTVAAAICQQPVSMQGKPITALQEMSLHCRKPSIIEEPRDVEINFGNTVYFSCKADGDPMPSIVWYKNNYEINPSSEPRYSIMNDGTLMIANTQDQDTQGVYECMATSTIGSVKSRSAQLKYKKSVQKSRPRFRLAPSDQNVNEGNNIKLNCEAVGVPEPEITWMLNDQPLILTQRHELLSKGSLLIKNAVKGDAGIYRCTASNSVGKVATIAEVRVRVPPVWLTTPLDQSVQLGARLELECDATENAIITWTHNGRNPATNGRIVTSNQGHQLRVDRIIQEDEGEYTCRAENSAGALDATANIRVIGGTPPVFAREPLDSVINVRVGQPVQFECSATGYPTPAIVWRRGHLTIIENSKYTILPSGTLIINRFNPDTDAGVYECVAFNDHGVITSEPLRVDSSGVRAVAGGHERVDNAFLFSAISQARKDVELAENDTVSILFGHMEKTEVKSPVDLLRIVRFPKPEGRNIARSAEVYERTLQIISKHAEEMNFNSTGEYEYKDLLTPSQLETLGRFSGCISHRKPKRNCSLDMCFHARYRSIDGSCNNFGEPMWGMSYTPFERLLNAQYENGFNLPIGWTPGKLYNGYSKPFARQISSQIIRTETISPDLVYTHMLMQWGQFLDHDLDHTLPSLSIESFGERVSCRRTCENVAPCFPMQAPEGDDRVRTRKCMEFTRSAAVCGSGITSLMFDSIQQREQINQLTAYIDASQVYGSSEEELLSLRSKTESSLLLKGIYMSHNKPLMPFATDDTPVDCRRDSRESDVGCFLGGDIRVNEQLGLLAMHTIWFRQHNFIAGKLKEVNPRWDDEVIFQEARKIVGAQMQHITYAHWLPYVIGQRGMREMGSYQGYDPQVNPTITTEFATAALRFGHTLINPVLRRLDENFRTIREGDLPLRSAFFAPWRLVEEGGLDPLIRGLFATPAKLKKPQELLNSHLTEDLFTNAHIVALDLASMNIQRGRDHGIPSYNEYRVWCNLSRARTFNDLQVEIPNRELREKLESVYKHVDNIDLWVGGVAEEPQDEDARVGPTFRCILVDQFRKLRDGDRFWYENPSVFRPEQLIQLKQTTLAKVLCDNGDLLLHSKRDVFSMDSELVRCDVIQSMQFAFWATDCCGSVTQSVSPATCPLLQGSNTESNQITNIRPRRHSRHHQKERKHNERRLLKREINSSSYLNSTSDMDFVTLEKFEKTLSVVRSTVSALSDRILELESKCSSETHTPKRPIGPPQMGYEED